METALSKEVKCFLSWKDLQGGGLAAMSCPTLGDPIGLVAFQASLFKGFSMQEYWNGLPYPSPGIFPPPNGSLALQVGSLPTELPGKP